MNIAPDETWWWTGEKYCSIRCPICGEVILWDGKSKVRVKFGEVYRVPGTQPIKVPFVDYEKPITTATCGTCDYRWRLNEGVWYHPSWDRPGIKMARSSEVEQTAVNRRSQARSLPR